MDFFDNPSSLPGGNAGGASRHLRSAHEAVNGCLDPVPVTQLGDVRVVVNAQLLIAGMAASDLSAAVVMAGNVARVRGAMGIEKKAYEAVQKFWLRKGDFPLTPEQEQLADALCHVDRIEFSSLSPMGLLHLFEATCRVMDVPRDSVEYAQLEDSVLLPRLKARETSAAAVRAERADRAASEGQSLAETEAQSPAGLADLPSSVRLLKQPPPRALSWRVPVLMIVASLAAVATTAGVVSAYAHKVARDRAATHPQTMFVAPQSGAPEEVPLAPLVSTGGADVVLPAMRTVARKGRGK